jgi:peptidoglycan hydrolase CwlO-like protein/3D (Asp-Asp-Asp) domain-containing protein
LDTLSTQLTEKTTEVEITKGAVERAKNDAQNQYKDMCMRIKYMYEHGKGDLLVSLLEADDLTEFLNKCKQITEMTTYDRNRLADYKESLEIVENKEEELVAEQANLENLKSQNETKQAELKTLAEKTDADIAAYTADISAEELERSALQKQIDEQTSQIEALKEKAAEEEAARKEAERREAEARALAEKKAEEQRQAEAEAEALKQRQAESAAAEEATAEARAQAEEEAAAKRAAEAAAEEAAAAEAEARRAAEEAEAARKAAEEAAAAEAAQRAAEEEAARKAAEEEAQRAAEEAARAAEEEESRSGKTYLGTFKITAYCHCAKCNGRAGQPTASGAWPYSGHTVAMGGVPFGTKLLINGTVYTVEDRGTPYGHVDIFMDSHEEALDWGLHYIDVYQVN